MTLIIFYGFAATISAGEFEDIDRNLGTPENTLRLLNLNVAHGRGDAVSQIFLDKSTISRNLSKIAQVLETHKPDLVAFQEADRPSIWSGNLDHVRWIASIAGYTEFFHSPHASNWIFDYGTALLSLHPIVEAVHHKFEPSPPTFRKGFSLGRILWKIDFRQEKPLDHLFVDVVSLHLDYSRGSVRAGQIEELIDVLSGRSNPLIIMGDINSDWLGGEDLVQYLVAQLKLQVYKPDAEDLGTYTSNNKRLDWILISREFEFVEYDVLPDVLSDHFAVVATIKLK